MPDRPLSRGARVDRRLSRGRPKSDAIGRLLDLSCRAEHAAGGAGTRAWLDLDDTAHRLREGSRCCDGHPIRLSLLCHLADRLPDGAVWPGRPRAARRRRLSRRVGETLPGYVIGTLASTIAEGAARRW